MDVGKHFLTHAVNDLLSHLLEHPRIQCIESKTQKQHYKIDSGRQQKSTECFIRRQRRIIDILIDGVETTMASRSVSFSSSSRQSW